MSEITHGVRLSAVRVRKVYYVSLGEPAGVLWPESERGKVHLPGDFKPAKRVSPWWALTGSVEKSLWTWDGIGRPVDFRGQPVRIIAAFLEWPDDGPATNKRPTRRRIRRNGWTDSLFKRKGTKEGEAVRFE